MSHPNREQGAQASTEAELQRAFGLLAEMTRRFADSLEIEPVEQERSVLDASPRV